MRLAVWDSDEKELRVVSSWDGVIVRTITGVLGFAWDPLHVSQFVCLHDDGRVVRSDLEPDAARPELAIARVGIGEAHVHGIYFFQESWQDPNQPTDRYLVLHTQSGSEGTLSFIAADQSTEDASSIFTKSLAADVKIATSPTDPIFVTGDSTGTLRVWFASPTYRIANQVFDLRSDGDAPIIKVAFDGKGNTLITSDGNRRVYGWMSRDSHPAPQLNDQP
jgi:WD40 repeat protein